MGQAATERDEVAQLADDVERIRRRGESLTTELLKRAQPSIRRARAVVSLVQRMREVLHRLAQHKVAIASALLVTTGMVTGVIVEKARRRRRLQRSPAKKLLALVSGR